MATEQFVRNDGLEVWVLDIPYAIARMRRVVTLSGDGLLFRIYTPHDNLDGPVGALRSGQSPADVLGRKATEIRLADIRHVEKLDLQHTLTIRYLAGAKDKKLDIWTPGCEQYALVFAAIHKRLGGTLPITSQQATVEQSLSISPLAGCGVIVLLFLALAAMFPEDVGRQVITGRGEAAAQLLQWAGSKLGRAVGWSIAAAIIGGIIGMIIYRLRHRPETQSFAVRSDA